MTWLGAALPALILVRWRTRPWMTLPAAALYTAVIHTAVKWVPVLELPANIHSVVATTIYGAILIFGTRLLPRI